MDTLANMGKGCFPIAEGGLGVRSLGDMVKAFACKFWWRVWQRESIRVKFMFSKYVREWHPLVVVTHRPMGTWKRLLDVREVAKTQIRWSLGASLVDFWLDTWCGNTPLNQLVPLDMKKPHFLVAKFYGRDGWNVDRLRQWLLTEVVEQILLIPFDPQRKDEIVWSPSSTGKFSLGSTW